MDYKTLYGLIFIPIVLSLLYIGYLGYGGGDSTESITKISPNTIYMDAPLKQNFEQIGKQEFSEELKNAETILIDIRRPEELTTYGIIQEEQLHIEFGIDSFSKQILKLDKTKKYLIYCWHGARSAAARDFMKENGFHRVKDLKGGIDTWNQQ